MDTERERNEELLEEETHWELGHTERDPSMGPKGALSLTAERGAAPPAPEYTYLTVWRHWG